MNRSKFDCFEKRFTCKESLQHSRWHWARYTRSVTLCTAQWNDLMSFLPLVYEKAKWFVEYEKIAFCLFVLLHFQLRCYLSINHTLLSVLNKCRQAKFKVSSTYTGKTTFIATLFSLPLLGDCRRNDVTLHCWHCCVLILGTGGVRLLGHGSVE